MACNWSAENATRAYLKTMKMGNRGKEPAVAEFVSALAAGNNAQLMVVVAGGVTDTACSTTFALAAAAHQTGGRIVCILRNPEHLCLSKSGLGSDTQHVEFVVGEAESLLTNQYKEADFVAIDCGLRNHEGIFRAVGEGERRKNGAIFLGYNANEKESWSCGGLETQFLPIGEGLLLSRIAAKAKVRSHWVVKVDKCTGEEHVFRVRSPQGRFIEA